MIGKMYRPLRIAKKNRGFKISHKYISNLLGRGNGGIKTFEQIVDLTLVDSDKDVFKESIRLEFKGLTVPIILDESKFQKVTTKQAEELKEPFVKMDEKRSGTLNRRMDRPGAMIELESENEHPFTEFKTSEWEEEKGKFVLKSDMSSSGGGLFYEMPIHPTGDDKGADWLKVVLKPIVINGEEFMEVTTESKTQVIIVSENKIIYK